MSAGVATQAPAAPKRLHVGALGAGRVDDLVGVGVDRGDQTHSGDSERPQQQLVRGVFVRLPRDVSDEQAEQAVVEVAVVVVRPWRPRQGAGHAECSRRLAGTEPIAEELTAVVGESGGVRQQLAHGDGGDSVAGRHADDVGEALADGFVELQEAGVDELQDDGCRDDLGDAGDAETIGRGHRVERVVGCSCPESSGVNEPAVHRHGDGGGMITPSGQTSGDELVEASPRRSRHGRQRRQRRRGGGVVVVDVVVVDVVVVDVVVVDVVVVEDVGTVDVAGTVDGGPGSTAGAATTGTIAKPTSKRTPITALIMPAAEAEVAASLPPAPLRSATHRAAPLAQWKSSGLLIRWFRVRAPGGAPDQPS